MTERKLPTADDIYAVHEEIVAQWDLQHSGTLGVLPDERLGSIIESADNYDDPYETAAALLRGLASAHVFEDGNKRTSWVVSKTYLREQDLPVEPAGERAAVVLKHYKRFSVEELATWLKTGDIDTTRFRHDQS